jgi:hypothetical protein
MQQSERYEIQDEKFATPADLEREYHTLSQLAHPHVVEVYDYGIAASGPFYRRPRAGAD